MKKFVKVLLLLIFISVIAVGGYSWIKNRKPADQGFVLVDAVKGDITEKAVAIGQIEPRQKYHIKSKISGIVKRCPAEVGDTIDTGDPIIEISPDPTPDELLEAEHLVKTAQISFDRAKKDWEHSQELASEGIESINSREVQEEAYERAGIEFTRAKDRLQLIQDGRVSGRGKNMETIVRAPSKGILLQRLVNPGDPVVPLTSYQEGTELATLADMSDIIFKGTVDEIDVGKLKPDMPVQIKIGAMPDKTVTGRLSKIAPQAIEKDNAKLFEVEIALDSFEDITLRAGYSANADIIIREKKNILLIPERLVIFEDEGAKSFVEIQGETPEAEPKKVPVTVGLSDGLNVEVVSGINEGQKLVQRPPREITG
ncbi:MAG: efflux RND transporter periplasmic adaptor subunit [Deltaproteobacteria bacterium]|nr:efflux RND transporter periplasmic adaptor subunit [Deltaproteobacteria bacterium]